MKNLVKYQHPYTPVRTPVRTPPIYTYSIYIGWVYPAVLYGKLYANNYGKITDIKGIKWNG